MKSGLLDTHIKQNCEMMVTYPMLIFAHVRLIADGSKVCVASE